VKWHKDVKDELYANKEISMGFDDTMHLNEDLKFLP